MAGKVGVGACSVSEDWISLAYAAGSGLARGRRWFLQGIRSLEDILLAFLQGLRQDRIAQTLGVE